MASYYIEYYAVDNDKKTLFNKSVIRKSALFCIILSIFFATAFAQTSVVSAEDENPATSPVTSFARAISGRVTYQNIFRFFKKHHTHHKHHGDKDAAEDVTVQAKNKETGEVFTAKTDSEGEYVIQVPKGKYVVKVNDTTPDYWLPPYRTVNVTKKDKDDKDFTGFIF